MPLPPSPSSLSFGLLGPVRMSVDGEEIPLGREAVRGVLALLALDANTVVSLDRIVDVLWGVRPPATARTIVQGYVSRLRKLIEEHAPEGQARIVTRAPGYLLSVETSRVDVHHARDLLARSRNAPARTRAALLSEAAALWRGKPLSDLSRPVPVAELADLRLAIVSGRIEADLELGKDVELVGELRELLAEHPFFEYGVGQLMLALYRCGRRAEALECYREFARRTADELGIDPGPELAGRYGQLLRDDPRLATTSAAPGIVVPAQLPAADSGFVGRQQELRWLDGLLDEPRARGAATIAVVSGPAGVGKSALVLTWGHRLTGERFDGGKLYACLYGFDPYREPAAPGGILNRFLAALGVPSGDIPDSVEERAAMYRSLLAGRNMLVVLDDARDSAQVRPLLAGGGSSMVVVTSRRRLAGLAARDGARTLVLDMLTVADAGRVLARAQAPVGPEECERLVRLCGRLPLALRIMAARLFGGTEESIRRVLTELEDEHSRLGALHVEGKDTSVNAVLDVSYRRLPPSAARTMAELGVFPGEWLGVAELAAMCAATPAEASTHLLELSAANLVVEPSPGRFGMHDLVRLFARERAAELPEGEHEAALRRIVHYYLVVADTARRRLRPATDGIDLTQRYGAVAGPRLDDPQRALEWFEAQWQNLIAAQRAAADAGMRTEVWHFALVVHRFRMLRPLADGWLPVIELALASARAAGDRAGEAHIRMCRSSYHVTFDRVGEMVEDAESAVAIAQRLGEPTLLMRTLFQVVGTYAASGRFAEALQRGERLVVLARAVGNTLVESQTLANMAQAELELGRIQEAIAHQRAAMAIGYDSQDHSFAAHSHANLAELEMLGGRLRDAEEHARFAADLATGQELPMTEAFARQVLGSVLARRGRTADAEPELRRSLSRFRELGSPRAAAVETELRMLRQAAAEPSETGRDLGV